jgi:hypothetical protein
MSFGTPTRTASTKRIAHRVVVSSVAIAPAGFATDMIRIKSLQTRQRIFDDLAAINHDELRQKFPNLTDDQYKCFCTIDGLSEQIDAHLEAKNMHGLIFWMDSDGLIQRAAVDFDFI